MSNDEMRARLELVQRVILEPSVYGLANLANVSVPDEPESPGGAFLRSVRDATLEELEWELQRSGDEVTVIADAIDAVRDEVREIADAAVPVYTHQRMLTLVDLAAYFEDLDDYGGSGSNLVELADVSLYLVAERLVNALLDAVEQAADDEGNDEDEEV